MHPTGKEPGLSRALAVTHTKPSLVHGRILHSASESRSRLQSYYHIFQCCSK
jgi:hypothetical protein